jgi:HSP90 family molecular chaperone
LLDYFSFKINFYKFVSNKVCVTTKKSGENTGHIWTWTGGSDFEVAEKVDASVGTKVFILFKNLKIGLVVLKTLRLV